MPTGLLSLCLMYSLTCVLNNNHLYSSTQVHMHYGRQMQHPSQYDATENSDSSAYSVWTKHCTRHKGGRRTLTSLAGLRLCQVGFFFQKLSFICAVVEVLKFKVTFPSAFSFPVNMPFIVPKFELHRLLPWLQVALPASFKIYHDLKNHLDGKWPGVQFVVDQWPKPKAVVETLDSQGNEKPDCEAFLKWMVQALYSDDDQTLAELLQDPEVVDWSTSKTVCAVSNRLLDTVVKVCSKYGEFTDRFNYLLVAKQGDIHPLPVPDGMRLVPVDNELCETVDNTWHHRGEGSLDLVKSYVKKFPSLALLTDSGHHVGHMVGTSFNSMGMLYVQPEFRRQGFAKVIITNLAQKYFQYGLDACVLIMSSNKPSLELHTSIGFKIVPDFSLMFVSYLPKTV